MRVTAFQTELVWESPEENLAQLRAQLAEHPQERGSLLVLPEMWNTAFSVASTAIASRSGDLVETALSRLAAEHGIWIIAGLAVATAGNPGANQAVLFCADGSVHPDRYTKLFPFTPSGEAERFPPGEKIVLWEIGGLTVSPFICYDLRFPEPFGQAAAAGADTFVVVANFPARRQAHWDLLLRARAVECQANVVGVNRVGFDPNVEYLGGTAVVDPWGVTLASVENGREGFASAELSPSAVADAREAFPALADRNRASLRYPLTLTRTLPVTP